MATPNPYVCDLLHLLTITANLVAAFGWVTRGKAHDCPGLQATADQAIDYLQGIDEWDDSTVHGRENLEKFNAAVIDADAPAAAIEWAQNLDPTRGNSYEDNIRAIARNGGVTDRKHYGFACSIVTSFQRHQERQAKYAADNAADANSEHIGEFKDNGKGKRDTFTFTITGTRDIPRDFGSCLLYKFRDADGNVASWFCSGSPLFVSAGIEEDPERTRPAKIGDTVTVKATPKKHVEFRGVQETQMSRVALI